LVTGHVDGIGVVRTFEPAGESYLLAIVVPTQLARYFAFKGSVTVNGVSLTVNRVVDEADGTEISINLIPHTIEATTLKALKPTSQVNLEIDVIARYCERVLSYRDAT
jgi:riboflavin synthase